MTTKAELHSRVENNLTLHPPAHTRTIDCMAAVRAMGKSLAHLVVDTVPESREQSLALTDIEDAVQHAISGISRHEARFLVDEGVAPDLPTAEQLIDAAAELRRQHDAELNR